ncbi:MAG: sugar kinase [Clostridiaceae bacterium]|nr:sugar kinase [Clostridiaceae bacterium]
MKRVITFGEIMLRLAPEDSLRFFQNDRMKASFGGAEANVAVSLANYGLDAALVTKLPEHDIGRAAISQLKAFGVDTGLITRGGSRVGIYYLEKGASQRPSKVIYDRAYSALALAESSDFDWDEIFDGADWFHFTGITPALGKNVADICLEACRKAKERSITISCDLNYRKNLWTTEEAHETMSKLMAYVDLCIANEEDADKVFGIRGSETDVTRGQLNYQGYQDVALQLKQKFDFDYVAITLRSSISADDNEWSALLYDSREFYFSPTYPVHIVDRVGGGDSFGGGLIYGLLTGMSSRDALDFATAASCLKHSIEGDFNRVTVAEVENLVRGDASGRVQR